MSWFRKGVDFCFASDTQGVSGYGSPISCIRFGLGVRLGCLGRSIRGWNGTVLRFINSG